MRVSSKENVLQIHSKMQSPPWLNSTMTPINLPTFFQKMGNLAKVPEKWAVS